MPLIKVRIPHVDMPALRSGMTPPATAAKQILTACLTDAHSKRAIADVRSDLPGEAMALWFDDIQAHALALIAERNGLADQSAAASALLHAHVRATVDPSDPSTALPEPAPSPPFRPVEPQVPVWRITVVGRPGRQETIHWPIVQESDDAVRVETPGGAIWLPRHVVTPREIYGPNQVAALVGAIRDLSTGEELVQLFAAKEAKPGRWRASVQTVVPGRIDARHDRKRQIWLSAANMVRVGRKFYAARWIVTRALDDSRSYMANASPRSLRFAPDEGLPSGKGWEGLSQLERSITEVFERLTRS